jgi:hypothetical protein
MSEQLEISRRQKDAIDILGDGKWRWIVNLPEEGLQAGSENQLWLSGIATNRGYYPKYDPLGDRSVLASFRADYFTEEDGIPYRGMDLCLSTGEIRMLGRSLLTIIVDWPNPEFSSLDNTDRSLFIRKYNPGESLSGMFIK